MAQSSNASQRQVRRRTACFMVLLTLLLAPMRLSSPASDTFTAPLAIRQSAVHTISQLVRDEVTLRSAAAVRHEAPAQKRAEEPKTGRRCQCDNEEPCQCLPRARSTTGVQLETPVLEHGAESKASSPCPCGNGARPCQCLHRDSPAGGVQPEMSKLADSAKLEAGRQCPCSNGARPCQCLPKARSQTLTAVAGVWLEAPELEDAEPASSPCQRHRSNATLALA